MPMIIRNNIRYAGGSGGSNSGENIVELTQAEYDALGDVVNSDNITYYITDSDEQLDASSITFDDTETQLGANDVQGAIEKVATDISELNSKTEHVDFKREDWSKITLNRYSGKPSLEFTRPDADEKYTLRMTNNGMDFLLNDLIVSSTTLVTQKFKTDTIASLSDNQTLSVNVTKSGYTPIGVVSYNIGGGSYISLVNLYRLKLSENNVNIAIAPLSGTATNVYVEFTVLYVKSN